MPLPLIDAADEKRSVAVSSNRDPSGFDEIMPRPSPAASPVDRLPHHARLGATTGDSVRFAKPPPVREREMTIRA